MIFSIYIINKAGGLVFNKDYSGSLERLSNNEYLVLAGTLHGIHAITARISPVPGSSGLELLETDTFKLHCFQTLTGTKFILITDPNQTSSDTIMRRIYEIYSDFVMKNPFTNPDMPIRAELFEANLLRFVRLINGAAG
ncbi:Sybindin-like protein [Gonapodya prolifera JEL478]|uniref:Trafficking protein particle complex subunit n=1 Tax=Gonapodya prolifera (strain JEL478) TaxID=1344416 RepID=A0A139AGZ5_GONPJ|nr:Sybindin-like protein [Gonapodya prolifera JEL478]|eukprot:KXS16076.1 Sybindin-like protein [Gonapodya prolifera JEL478]